jgi:replication-associated recombination protein RarA
MELFIIARMIEGGEDVKFIARRMLILSSEDIGNAKPYCFHNGQQYFSSSVNNRLSRKAGSS